MVGDVDLGIEGLSDFRSIGAGGFATVYAAIDDDFGRTVAVKVLDSIDEDGRRRFDRERRALGYVGQHPNVVTAHRSGFTPEGSPYLVMEFVGGGSLEELLAREGPLSWELATHYLVPVADALAFGHREGVLHHDVKPANILLTEDGRPTLADFGISAIADSTATQAIAYSLAYAPPETFRGGVNQRDERSDLYSLAATLYAAVTGRPPFDSPGGDPQADSQLAYLARIAEQPVPSTGDPSVDGFFEIALAKNPAERPQTAADLIAALEAVRPSAVAAQSQGSPLAGTVLPGTALPGSVLPGSVSAVTVASGRPRSGALIGGETVPHGASSQRRRMTRRLMIGGATAAVAAIAGLVVVNANGSDPGNEQEPASSTSAGTSTTGDEDDTTVVPPVDVAPVSTFSQHDGVVWAVDIADDGRVVSAGSDTSILAWDPDDADAEAEASRFHDDSVEALAVLTDGLIVSGAADGRIRIWDRADASDGSREMAPLDSSVWALAALPSGLFASGTDDGVVRIWDPAESTDPILELEGHDGAVRALAALPDGRLVSGGRDGTTRVWEPTSEDPVAGSIVFTDSDGAVEALATLPDGRVIGGGVAGIVRVWDPDNATEPRAEFTGHTDGVVAVTALPDGRVASGGWDRVVLVWDPDNPSGDSSMFDEHTDSVETLASLPDGRVVSGSSDRTVRLWSPN